MPYMLIRHRVADFDRWRPVYDAHATARRAAGLDDMLLLRDAGDPNLVVILFRVSDVEKATAFGQSADLREKMVAAGVLGKPEISFLNQA